MAVVATSFVNMMESEPAWTVIMSNFGLSTRSVTPLIEDYSMENTSWYQTSIKLSPW